MISEQRKRLKHRVWLDVCGRVAQLATCARRRVGAVILDERGRVLSVGYNGVARGQRHCTSETPCLGVSEVPGSTIACEAIHAEQNAIANCGALRFAHTLYCSCTPCGACAKLILSTTITRVIVEEAYADTSGYNLLLDAGVVVYIYDASAISDDGLRLL